MTLKEKDNLKVLDVCEQRLWHALKMLLIEEYSRVTFKLSYFIRDKQCREGRNFFVQWPGFTLGDPERLVHPTDSNGLVCGYDAAVKDRPFLHFFDLTRCANPQVLTKGCPTPQVWALFWLLTGFYWVLPSFTRLLPGFTWFCRFCLVLLSFYFILIVLPGSTGFKWVCLNPFNLTGFNFVQLDLMCPTERYWA